MRVKVMRQFGIASSAILLLVSIAATMGTGGWTIAHAATPDPSPYFDYVVIIIMENHPLNISSCCGGTNGIIGNSQAPYITQLAKNNGLAENYFPNNPGSLPNYFALTGGDTFTNISCVSANSPPTSCIVPATNTVDTIEASGRTWKAYMEDYTDGCFGTSIPGGGYVYYHNPFPYYADIQSNSTRCNRIVAANPGHIGLPDNQLTTDLNSTTPPNYMWLTPNECNNMHDCPISSGDNYLSQLIPKILNSSAFTSRNAALFITWDEPTSCTCPIPAIWVGSRVKHNYLSMTSYTHYSFLKTVESAWNLSSLTPNDSAANSMNEFFQAATVGGVILPVEKIGLLAPYIALAVTAALVMALGIGIVIRNKHPILSKR